MLIILYYYAEESAVITACVYQSHIDAYPLVTGLYLHPVSNLYRVEYKLIIGYRQEICVKRRQGMRAIDGNFTHRFDEFKFAD